MPVSISGTTGYAGPLGAITVDTGSKWHEIEALEDGTVFVNVFSEGKY